MEGMNMKSSYKEEQDWNFHNRGHPERTCKKGSKLLLEGAAVLLHVIAGECVAVAKVGRTLLRYEYWTLNVQGCTKEKKFSNPWGNDEEAGAGCAQWEVMRRDPEREGGASVQRTKPNGVR
jgi:hypothetical protein